MTIHILRVKALFALIATVPLSVRYKYIRLGRELRARSDGHW